MAQSLVKNYIHIVFSTKHRQPLISSTFENEIHSYLAGTCKPLECTPIMLADTPIMFTSCACYQKKISLFGLLRELKAPFVEMDQNKR